MGQMPLPQPLLRAEKTGDVDAVRQVNRLAFGQDAEGRLVDRLRDEGYTRVSLVAEIDGRIVGHILFSDLPIETDGGAIPAVALAPMAVVPDHQRRGIGSALVRAGLEACREQGFRVAIVLGHRAFYPRFGFSSALARQINAPYSGEDFMAVELEPGAIAGATGRVAYPPPFAEV
jgi:putative acetyltransferase